MCMGVRQTYGCMVSAGGRELPIVNNVKATVKLSSIVEVPEHSFIVVEQLILPSEVDSCSSKAGYYFTTSPVSVTVARQRRPTPVSTVPAPAPPPDPEAPLQLSVWKAE